MKTNKKWKKSISVVLLVALASLATTGLVLADHFPPVGNVAVSSNISFEQYQVALEHMESDREAAMFTSVDTRSQDSFTLYLDEYDQTELDRSLSTVSSLISVDSRNRESFEESLDAFDEMEREKNAALKTAKVNGGDYSTLSWEQYSEYAR